MDIQRPIFTNSTHLYDEVLNLLEEARDFLLRSRSLALSELATTQFSIESTRLTARLTEMMAWLLGRRAVASGEISYEIGRDRFRLNFQSVCDLDQSSMLEPELNVLADLLDRSLQVYRRVAALDAAFDMDRPENIQARLVSG